MDNQNPTDAKRERRNSRVLNVAQLYEQMSTPALPERKIPYEKPTRPLPPPPGSNNSIYNTSPNRLSKRITLALSTDQEANVRASLQQQAEEAQKLETGKPEKRSSVDDSALYNNRGSRTLHTVKPTFDRPPIPTEFTQTTTDPNESDKNAPSSKGSVKTLSHNFSVPKPDHPPPRPPPSAEKRVPVSASERNLQNMKNNSHLSAPPPPVRPPPRAPRDDSSIATHSSNTNLSVTIPAGQSTAPASYEVSISAPTSPNRVENKPDVLIAPGSPSSAKKLQYHSQAAASWDVFTALDNTTNKKKKDKPSNALHIIEAETKKDKDKKDKRDKKEKKIGKALSSFLSVNKGVDTDSRIQDYLKSIGVDELSSTLFNSVIKELSKQDPFVSVVQTPKDWNLVEADYSTVDPQIQSLIEITRAKTEGFKFEFGRNAISYKNEIKIEDPEKDVPYYQNYLHGKEHYNYMAEPLEDDKVTGGVCISMEYPAEKPEERKCIVRSKKGTDRIVIPAESSSSEKEMLKYIKTTYPDWAKLKFVKITDPELPTMLLQMEHKAVALVSKYKFGVLYAKEGQVDENEMFSNNEPSPDYAEFLEFLGEKIELKGWPHYRGGLDVKNNTTGTHSIYTKHRDYEIMFHVATLLPFQPEDKQRVERKRHLGNDIVVIIFKDGDQPFDPLCLTTHFNHVFVIIMKDKQRTDKTYYKVMFANKIGVPPYGPFLKNPPIYEKNEHFRDFLITKFINSERAAIEWAPEFRGKMVRTRKQLLEDLAKEYIQRQKEKKWEKKEKNAQEENTIPTTPSSATKDD